MYEGLTVNNYTLTVGVFRSVHELWSAKIDVGGRYTISQFDVLGEQQENEDWGWVADASVIYTGERTHANFTLSSNIAPAYGSVGAVQRNTAVVHLRRRFLYELSGTLSAGYFLNKSQAGQYSFRTIDEQSTLLRPGLRWEATKNILLEAAYQYYWLRNELRGGPACRTTSTPAPPCHTRFSTSRRPFECRNRSSLIATSRQSPTSSASCGA